MPTNSAYTALVGKERIISVLNNDGEPPDAVPLADLEIDYFRVLIPTFPLSHPSKGNRKVLLIFQMDALGGQSVVEDDQIAVRVKVPAGVIKDSIQRFKFDATIDYTNPDPAAIARTTSPFDYMPVTRIIPLDRDTISEDTVAYPIVFPSPVKPWQYPDEQDQSIVVVVERYPANGGAGSQFFLEIDWYHTIDN
jgi:hypothetical protein